MWSYDFVTKKKKWKYSLDSMKKVSEILRLGNDIINVSKNKLLFNRYCKILFLDSWVSFLKCILYKMLPISSKKRKGSSIIMNYPTKY